MSAFESPYWTQIQLLAWVCLRSRDAVDEAPDSSTDSEESSSGLFVWGYCEVHGTEPRMSYEAAKKEILRSLAAGELQGYGLNDNRGHLTEIPVHQWPELDFYFAPDFAGPREVFRSGAPCWYGLQFPSADALKLWPEALESAADNEEAAEAGDTAWPKDLRWEDVVIRFVPNGTELCDTVHVSARSLGPWAFSYADLGLRDRRNSARRRPWIVFELMARNGGVFDPRDCRDEAIRNNLKPYISRLRAALRKAVPASGNPVRWRGGAYRFTFSVMHPRPGDPRVDEVPGDDPRARRPGAEEAVPGQGDEDFDLSDFMAQNGT